MSLRDTKAKIRSVDRTRKVTKAMEAVSAVKMRKSQGRAFEMRPYARAAVRVLSRVSSVATLDNHPLTTVRPVSRAALVVVTSDKGLCGILNAAVLKRAEAVLAALALPKAQIEIYAYGKKAAEYFDRRGYTLKARFENISDDVAVTDLDVTTTQLQRAFEAGTIDTAVVVYTNFKSTFEQEALAHTLLPLSLAELAQVEAGITPEKGARHDTPPAESDAPAAYTFEGEGVVDAILSRVVGSFLYHMLLESKASEHSSRMIAMKNASDKSLDVSRSLNRAFNKARQAGITREVSEIVGGIEAMAA